MMLANLGPHKRDALLASGSILEKAHSEDRYGDVYVDTMHGSPGVTKGPLVPSNLRLCASGVQKEPVEFTTLTIPRPC